MNTEYLLKSLNVNWISDSCSTFGNVKIIGKTVERFIDSAWFNFRLYYREIHNNIIFPIYAVKNNKAYIIYSQDYIRNLNTSIPNNFIFSHNIVKKNVGDDFNKVVEIVNSNPKIFNVYCDIYDNYWIWTIE